MKVESFEEIEAEFMRRIQEAVYCNVATVDLKGRPRSRVMHLIWDGPIGWVISSQESPKARHLANNAHVSLAYIKNAWKPAYADCVANWENNPDEKQRIWELFKTTPPPLGYDPAAYFGTNEWKDFGFLRFIPWRVELAELQGESLIWQAGAG